MAQYIFFLLYVPLALENNMYQWDAMFHVYQSDQACHSCNSDSSSNIE